MSGTSAIERRSRSPPRPSTPSFSVTRTSITRGGLRCCGNTDTEALSSPRPRPRVCLRSCWPTRATSRKKTPAGRSSGSRNKSRTRAGSRRSTRSKMPSPSSGSWCRLGWVTPSRCRGALRSRSCQLATFWARPSLSCDWTMTAPHAARSSQATSGSRAPGCCHRPGRSSGRTTSSWSRHTVTESGKTRATGRRCSSTSFATRRREAGRSSSRPSRSVGRRRYSPA